MPERTIIMLFNLLVGGVYMWKIIRFEATQEVGLRPMGESWRRTGSRSE